MNRTTWLQECRMEKFHDVLRHFEAQRLWALEAAELLGMSERSYRHHYEEEGLEGMFDRRLSKVAWYVIFMSHRFCGCRHPRDNPPGNFAAGCSTGPPWSSRPAMHSERLGRASSGSP